MVSQAACLIWKSMLIPMGGVGFRISCGMFQDSRQPRAPCLWSMPVTPVYATSHATHSTRAQ